jgi:DHA2 family multidrug resistance protein
MLPLSQTILLDSYPRNEIGRAMSIWGMGAMVAPILGPTLGGYLTEEYSWRWCFYINLPIGMLTVLAAFVFIPDSIRDRDRKFDWMGFGFFALAIGATQLGLDRGEHLGWFQSLEIQIEAALALFGFYMFAAHSATTPRPFIDLGLFRDRNFVISLVLLMVISIVLNGSLVLTPQLLQTELGYPVVTSGLIMGPRGFGTIAAMFFFGRMANRIDPRLFLAVGLSVLAGTMYAMSQWSLSVGAPQIIAIGLLQGAGIGLVFGPMTSVAFSTLAGRLRAEGSGFYALMRNLGGAVGISIVVSRLTELTQTNHAQLGAFFTPFRHLAQGTLASGAAGLRLLDLDITHQAGMVAYVNVFRLLAVFSIAFMPLLMLIRKAGAQAAAVVPAEAAAGH